MKTAVEFFKERGYKEAETGKPAIIGYGSMFIDTAIRMAQEYAEQYCEEKMKPFIEELTYLRQYHKDMEDTINDSKKMGELLAGI